MGPPLKREDLEGVLRQINGRFDFFTKEVARIEARIDELTVKPAAKKEKVANGS